MMTAALFSPGIAIRALDSVAASVLDIAKDGLPDDEIRMAVDICRTARASNLRADREFRDWVAKGTAGHVHRTWTRQYLEAVQPYIDRFKNLRTRLATPGPYVAAPDQRYPFFIEFLAFVDEADAFYQLVKSVVDLAMAPGNPPDLARIQKAEEAHARGEMKVATPGFLTGRRPS